MPNALPTFVKSMRRFFLAACFLTPTVTFNTAMAQESGQDTTLKSEDKFQWLEDVSGDEALNWVKERNAKTISTFAESDDFKKLESDLLTILDSDDRIPFVGKSGDFYYNFWRDKNNVRGIWRRTSLDEYQKASPEWEVLIDLDKLASDEDENWVWKGASILKPQRDRALITLSRGGADATVTREFSLKDMKFIKDGFYRPEAKGSIGWIDENTVFVQTDFGPGSMTESGYPRQAKRWKRGTPLAEAELVYEGKEDDMSIGASHDHTPGYSRSFVYRSIAFYNNELFLLKDDGQLVKIPAQNSASKYVHKSTLALELREDWEYQEKNYKSGSLLFLDFESFLNGKAEVQVIFEPTDTTALADFGFTRNFAYIKILDNVKDRIVAFTNKENRWEEIPMVGLPSIGTLSLSAIDPDESDEYFLTSTDYITPTTLSIGKIGEAPRALKTLPAMYDATGLEIQQHFATSADGTKVPYFMVSKKGMKLDGNNPTLLYGYGGFEISLLPSYSATVGRAWTSQGGVYVVANIRGGGEYGPRWHRAALKQNRNRAYEDFAAVATDLIKKKVTSSRRLGIQGGSNGGLLVGNMVTQYPELFHAAVCQVPLLDMLRYNKLLAGASWMAEYGNPDLPEEWAFIQKFSPYHNLRKEQKYPHVLFTTSTRDDRVHPGHARKMMAKMEEDGHSVAYYENIEGGHGGAANNKQSAFMSALAYTFLKARLFD